MSFQDLAISVSAENNASSEFSKIVADADKMAGDIAANQISIEFAPIDVPEIPPIPIPEIPPIDVTPIYEISNATEYASRSVQEFGGQVVSVTQNVTTCFQSVGNEAENMAEKVNISSDSIKEMSRDFTTLGVGISAIGRLGETFGVLNEKQSAALRTMGLTLSAVSSVVRAIQIFSSATSIATSIQNALNISYGTFLALTGVGIAVILAAATAMTIFASKMDNATSSVRSYNAATSDSYSSSRNVRRAGDDALRRRGIE